MKMRNAVLLVFAVVASVVFSAPNDLLLTKRNAGDTAFEQVTLADPGGAAHMYWNGATNAPGYLKANLNATVDPTTGDDTGDGYAVGSVWINTTGDKVFVCADATAAAAVWKDVSGAAGAVDSVHGRTGAVVAVDGDYSQSLITGLKTSDSPTFAGATVSGNTLNFGGAAPGNAMLKAVGDVIKARVGDDSADATLTCLTLSSTGQISNGSGGAAITGNITVSGTVDGRDVAADGTKLDGVEAAADVTDAANVNAAGAVMETDFNANTILAATADNTPLAVDATGLTEEATPSSGHFLFGWGSGGALRKFDVGDLPGGAGDNLGNHTATQNVNLATSELTATTTVDIHSPGDIFLELGDTVGTNKVSIRDSAGTEVAAIDSNGGFSVTDLASDTFKVKDNVDQSHGLSVVVASDLTADRNLTVTTGDANRSLTLNGDAALNQNLETTDTVQFGSLELGHATDTTIARSAAGTVTIEGSEVATTDDTQTLTGKTIKNSDNTLQIYTEKHAVSHTVSASECYGGVHYVTAAATITLPAASDGMSLTVISVGANAVSVDPAGTDLLVLDGTTLDDGDKATSPGAAGDIIVLTYYDATGWYAASNSWTDGGA